MERNWYLRVALIAGVFLFSVYQLVPTWFYFRLAPDKRATAEFDQSVPGWAPSASKHLNLGLDLQGGIHLALGVDVDRAVKARMARRADEVAEFLKGKGFTVESSKPTADGNRIAVKAGDPRKVESTVLDQYGQEMTGQAGEGGAVVFALRGKVLQDFQVRAVDQAEKIIRNRVDKWGVSAPDIKRRGNNQIQIQLPGFKDPGKAKELLGRTAQLEFKIADDESIALDPVRTELSPCPTDAAVGGLKLPLPDTGCWTAETVELPGGSSRQATLIAASNRTQLEAAIEKPAKPKLQPGQEIGIGEGSLGGGVVRERYYRTYLLHSKTELTGDYISDARAATDNSTGAGKPVVTFTMTPDGGRLMERLTTNNLGRRMATVLDSKVETAPYIQGKISTNGQITLGSGQNFQQMFEDANEIALVLKAGALPAPVTIFEERTVGATLGPELIKKGTTAAFIGVILVVIFMILYYRATGLIADLALVLNGLLVLAVMSVLGSTLTLPGIAGFVLTLGMAVDANVLINERIREELRAGRSVRQAVDQGYDKVFWTIVDSHVTTLVAGVVLMQYGSGPVRGFAVTLIIGLVASMFTSIVVTRAFMDFFTRRDATRLSV